MRFWKKSSLTFCWLLAILAGCGRRGGGDENIVTPQQQQQQQPTATTGNSGTSGEKGRAPVTVAPPPPLLSSPLLPGKPDVEVRPVDLYSDYGQNEATGDAKYLGKVVQSTASACQLYKDAGGAYVIAMTAQADLAPCVLWRMHPTVKASDLAHIVAEPTAPPITIKGVCRGTRPSRQTLSGKQVILDGAVLVAVTAPKK